MELSALAAKQKRLKDWLESLTDMVQDESLRQTTLATALRYKNLLVRCWERQCVGEREVEEIMDLERQLEKLNELARMTVVPKFYNTPKK